VKNEAAVWC